MQPKEDTTNESVSSTINSIFDEPDVQPEEITGTGATPVEEPSTPPAQEPPVPAGPDATDDIPDGALMDLPPTPAADSTAPSEEADLLPLPSDAPDTIPEDSRSVVERYAFETREERRKRKAAEQELANLRANPPQPEGPTPEERQQLETRIAELENDLGQLDLSKSPAFRQQYETPIQELDRSSELILRRSGMDEAAAGRLVQQIAQEQDLRQRELLFDDVDNVDLSPNIIGSLIQNSVRRDELAETREAALKDWKTSKAAVEERAAREKQARDSKEVQTLLSQALGSAREEGNPFFVRIDGNENWNGSVGHFEDAVTGVLQRNDRNEIAKLVAHGLTFPRLLSRYSTERTRRQALERDLMSTAQPSDPAPGRPAAAPVPRRQSAPKTSNDIINEMFPA